MSLCRFCAGNIEQIIDFGDMPIANNFVPSPELDSYRFKLIAGLCKVCYLFQLVNQPKPEQMFNENYPFFSGLSIMMTAHFKEMVEEALIEVDRPYADIQVMEIGCNDGTLLSNLAEAGIRHLGVDPSANVVAVAQSKGVNAQVDFFGFEIAKKIKKRDGEFDLILAANVICHIPDIRDFANGINHLLSKGGRFIFEEPYAGDVLAKTSYDQFYDEHVYIFSCTSVSNIFGELNLEIIDARHQDTHGGSMRYTLARKGEREVKESALHQLAWEDANGLNDLRGYLDFAKNCLNRKTEFISLLTSLKNQGKTVAGYAATSKSTTVLNYCEIDKGLIQYISDSTPQKQGTLTPGSGIPVVTPDALRDRKPDYIVLFAWNHEKEIMQKEQELTASGSKWIRFVPQVEIL